MENATVQIAGLSIAPHKCSFCLVMNVKLFNCSRCHCAKYCSKECQKKHYKLHKSYCKDSGDALNKLESTSTITPCINKEDIEKMRILLEQFDADGNYRKAGEYLSYIYDYYMKELGENDDKTCEALLELGLNYHKQKKYVEADLLFRSVFTPIEKKLEKGLPIPSYFKYLLNYYATNLLALEKYDEAVKILKQLLGTLPVDGCDDSTISCTSNLATGLMNIGKLDEADEMFSALLKKSRAVHGLRHRTTLNCMNSIGSLYIKFKRYADAEEVFSECFELQKESLGINHPLTLSTLNNLFHVFINQRKFDKAATACAQCLEKRKLVLGYDNRDTLFSMNNWAAVLVSQNRNAEAEEVFKDCLGRMKIILGKEDENTVNTTIRLIRLYEQTGRSKEAMELKKTIPTARLKNI